ncbi:N-acetylglucosamine kinase [Microbacterium sp.]|uniref:N-acetylglucosamine kinase n=1 Tax=Microbacterium sp. TaxID=51671 RepID=UPI003F80CDC1
MTLPVLDIDASGADHVIGVDIGGTKTHLRAAPVDRGSHRPARDIVLPSSSWRKDLGDFRADGVGLRRLLLDQFGDAALRAPLAVGAHGCDSTEQCDELERELRRHISGPVLVVNDSELMAPAMNVTGAIGVVVGTGSIATARTPDGDLLTAGGWGWLLGDEGSAPGLVRDATRAVLSHLDRGDHLDALGERLLTCFSAVDGAELALTVTQVASAEAWGRHAAEVFIAADEGSTIAQLVVANAGERLAGLIDRLLRRGAHAHCVVAGGSVIEKQPLLQRALRTALAQTRPHLDLHILDRAPVTGAVALARRLAEQATITP